jgi:arginase family enzyme
MFYHLSTKYLAEYAIKRVIQKDKSVMVEKIGQAVEDVTQNINKPDPAVFRSNEHILVWGEGAGNIALNDLLNDGSRQVLAIFGEPDDTGAVKNMGFPGAREPQKVVQQLFAQLDNNTDYSELKIVYLGNIVNATVDTQRHANIRPKDFGATFYDNVEDNYEVVKRTTAALRKINPDMKFVIVGGDNGYSSVNSSAFEGRKGLVAFDPHLDARTKTPKEGDPRLPGSNSGTYVTDLIETGQIDVRQLYIIGANDKTQYYDERYAWLMEQGIDPRKIVPYQTVDEWRKENRLGAEIERIIEQAKGRTDVLHVMIDMDVVDSVHAPGVSARNLQGGFTKEDILQAAKIAGASGAQVVDLMEVSPSRDIGGVTTVLGGQILLNYLEGLNEYQSQAASDKAAFNEVTSLLKAKNWSKAYRRLKGLLPGDFRGGFHHLYVQTMFGLKSYPEALKFARKAARKFPQNADLKVDLLKSYLYNEMYGSAEDFVRQNPKDYQLIYESLMFHLENRMYENVAVFAEKMIRDFPIEQYEISNMVRYIIAVEYDFTQEQIDIISNMKNLEMVFLLGKGKIFLRKDWLDNYHINGTTFDLPEFTNLATKLI